MAVIPKYIRNKMHRIAKLHAEAAKDMRTVEAWLEANGYDVDTLRDGGGYSLEELDYGNDVTDTFCARLEDGFYLANKGETE